MSLARSLSRFVAGRLLGRGLDRVTAKALPGAMNVGVDAERHSHATARWRDSGYDLRLVPYAWPDEATQRNYDLYDAWANRGYGDDSEFWPPRTLRPRPATRVGAPSNGARHREIGPRPVCSRCRRR